MASAAKRILIIEDEYFLAELIKVRLESMDYAAEIAENGQEALDKLKDAKIDLIIMDAMMPVMDGWTATEKIKADKNLKHIPIIFLTAMSRHEDHIRAHKLGASDYISKPFEAEELISKISKLVGDSKRQ